MFQKPGDRVDTSLTSRITVVGVLNSLVFHEYWIWIRRNEDNNLEANKGKAKNKNWTWKVVILWEDVTRREERGPKSDYNSLRASLSHSVSRRVGGMNNVGVNSMGAGSHSVFRYSVRFFFKSVVRLRRKYRLWCWWVGTSALLWKADTWWITSLNICAR